MRRRLKLNRDFSHALWQALSGTDVKRHARPTPVVKVHCQHGESFRSRIGSHAFFLAITRDRFAADGTWPILAAYTLRLHSFRGERSRGGHGFDLLVADGFR